MKNHTIELTEPQIKILMYMYRDFNFDQFIKNNPEIEEEGSVSWYDDELGNLFNDIYDLNEEFKK